LEEEIKSKKTRRTGCVLDKENNRRVGAEKEKGTPGASSFKHGKGVTFHFQFIIFFHFFSLLGYVL